MIISISHYTHSLPVYTLAADPMILAIISLMVSTTCCDDDDDDDDDDNDEEVVVFSLGG